MRLVGPVGVDGFSFAASAAGVSVGGCLDAPGRQSVAAGDLDRRLGQRSALFELGACDGEVLDAALVAVGEAVEPVGLVLQPVDFALPVGLSGEVPGP
ncbi:hypothetical protein C5C86_16865, partial [Rathayibacter sp. AY1E4]